MPLVIDEAELRRLPITVDPEVVSGAPVFRGTRVPVDALIENLEAGLTLDEFLDNFPTVRREQAGEVLERAEQRFDVLVTADQSFPYQQNLAGRRLAVVVLPSNNVPVVVGLLPDLERVLGAIQPGDVVE